MLRSISCLAVLLLAGLPLRAGELDAEFGGGAIPASVASLVTLTPDYAPSSSLLLLNPADRPAGQASELDAESPAQSCFGWRGLGLGGFGWGRGLGLGWGGGWGGWGGGLG